MTTRMLCSIRMMASPRSATRFLRRCISADASPWVIPAVGSSRSSSAGSDASARASSSRRRSPYGRLRATMFALAWSPTRSSRLTARAAGTVAGSRTPPRVARAEPAPASLRQLALTAARGEDPLRAEDHHQDEDDPEDHALVFGRLELGREIGEAVAEDGHSRVLQLVEPEREPFQ